MRLRISELATADIDSAWDYTARRWSPSRADALLDTFEETFRLLLAYPAVGRRRDELTPGIRSLPASGFVVFYQFTESTLDVVRLIHGSRDIAAIFERE